MLLITIQRLIQEIINTFLIEQTKTGICAGLRHIVHFNDVILKQLVKMIYSLKRVDHSFNYSKYMSIFAGRG